MIWAQKVVLVTGASSGIGLAVAKGAAERGAFVALVARRAAALEAVAERTWPRSPTWYSLSP